MYCAYAKFQSEFSQPAFIKNPSEFDDKSKKSQSFKHVAYLVNPSEEESQIRVHSIGHECAFPEKSYVNRILAEDTAIHYVIDGEGTYNGQPVRKNDCFVFFRNKPHTLCTDKNNRLKMYWILIRHPEEFPVSFFGLDEKKPIFKYNFESDVVRIFTEMLHYQSTLQDPHLFHLGKLYELMSFHKIDTPDERMQSTDYLYSNYIALAKRMWFDTSYSISVEKMAHTLGFSRKHFSYIFWEKTGVLPQQYLLESKMKVAKKQLETGAVNLERLSFDLGYSDYSSFSRAFKKITGLSPRKYINQKTEHPD